MQMAWLAGGEELKTLASELLSDVERRFQDYTITFRADVSRERYTGNVVAHP
jgi:uncharacterized protein YeeX (DUF496 family)